jgi:hypothetical protein
VATEPRMAPGHGSAGFEPPAHPDTFIPFAMIFCPL